MRERLPFLLGYVGSAAVVAFLAACLDAPRVATFTCDTPPGSDEERCVLAATWVDDHARSAAPRDADKVAIALQSLN
jgi:hypothetical protein